MVIKSGDLATVSFRGREFQVVVIEPDGLGKDRPTIGFGFNMMERNAGIPQSTLSTWVIENQQCTYLKLPSSKAFRVIEITSITTNNTYSVIEVADWFEIAVDLLVSPGRTSKSLKVKLGDFLRWFGVKGLYAEAYTALKGIYTQTDSRATTEWLNARELGKVARKIYTDLLQRCGCQDYDYAQWTDYIYLGLFGMQAREMKTVWTLMGSNPAIARNYIPESKGLEAVAHCEDLAVRLYVDDLQEAHDLSIKLTKRKFIAGE